MQLASPYFDDTEIEYVRRALNSGWVTQGPFVDEFEAKFSSYQNSKHAIATTSCTAALHLAMAALEIGAGDEVIVPAFTWITSAHCAEYMGAKAVFVDVDPVTFNIDPARIEAAITPKTKAIVAVHLFGLAADMDAVLELAARHDLYVVEDAACALGTTYKGKRVGTLGDIGCFSFHPRKTITTGEGGMLSTTNDAIAEKLKSLRNHGAVVRSAREDEETGPWSMNAFANLGYNLRLSDIQAAVGVAQFKKLEGLMSHRRAIANAYIEALSPLDQIALPNPDEHAFQSFVIRLKSADRQQRNTLMKHLASRDITTRPGTHSVVSTEYYREKYNLSQDDFPVANALEDTTVTLPLFPGMTGDDVKLVSGEIAAGLA